MKIKRRWTTDEDELLKTLYQDPSKKAGDIANMLNRKINSIHSRAAILGIKKITFNDIEVPEGTKICRKCYSIEPLDNFFRNSSKKDGHESYCRNCAKELKNQSLLKKALQKVEQEEQMKIEFINQNKDEIFICTSCNEKFDINGFSIFKKNDNNYTRNTICKKCACEKATNSHYNRIKKLGHK